MKLDRPHRLALSRLGTGKLRTALTMLGIIIGVAGRGPRERRPGRHQGHQRPAPVPGHESRHRQPGLHSNRGHARRHRLGHDPDPRRCHSLAALDGVQAVAPELTTSKLVVAGSQNETTRVIGTTPGYLSVFAYTMWVGHVPQPGLGRQQPASGGDRGHDRGQPEPDAGSIGSTIYVGGLPFELIGITQPKGGTAPPTTRS
jgi:hypothetical protein